MTVHLPRTAETGGLIGAAEPRHAKPTAYMINVARAGVTVAESVVRALAGEPVPDAANVPDRVFEEIERLSLAEATR